jgi:hypothetical protein
MDAQTNISTAERVLDKWGWPAFFLFIILVAIYFSVRALWPLVKDYYAKGIKAIDDAHALLKEQLNVANLRAEAQQREFLVALDEQRKSHGEAMRLQAEAHSKAIAEQTAVLREVDQSLKRVAEAKRRVEPK